LSSSEVAKAQPTGCLMGLGWLLSIKPASSHTFNPAAAHFQALAPVLPAAARQEPRTNRRILPLSFAHFCGGYWDDSISGQQVAACGRRQHTHSTGDYCRQLHFFFSCFPLQNPRILKVQAPSLFRFFAYRLERATRHTQSKLFTAILFFLFPSSLPPQKCLSTFLHNTFHNNSNNNGAQSCLG